MNRCKRLISLSIQFPNIRERLSLDVSSSSLTRLQETIMSRGDKSAYTDKQKRKAEHIEESYRQRGVSKEEAEKRAWSTVNKEDGGGNKSGSGRKNHSDKS
jgi:hypothetical protein